MNIRRLFLATMAFMTLGVGAVFGQSTWDGTGNWFTDDANWSPFPPILGDAVILSTGTITLDTVEADFGGMIMDDVTLNVTSGGSATFTGTSNFGDSPAGGTAIINVMDGGSLEFIGNTNWGRRDTDRWEINVSGTGSFTTSGGTADSWWGQPGQLTVRGPDAQVSVGNHFVGTTATVQAIITHATDHSAINMTGTLDIIGGATLKLDFDGVIPAAGDTWLIYDYVAITAGTFTNLDASALGGGAGFSVNYAAPGVINANGVEVEIISILDLAVDTTTGEVTMGNPFAGGGAYDIEGYTITSASGSLIAGSFTGMGEAGWAAAGGAQGPNFINETNFTGSTVLNTGDTFSLGNIFGGPIDGDGNGDAIVDGLDYLLWAANFGDDPADDPPGSPGNGDYNDDGVVDGLDYLFWASNFGAVGPGPGTEDLVFNFLTTSGEVVNGTVTYFSSAVAVPEPSTLALAGLALVGLLTARRRS